jgi:hypothetical protein
MGLRRSLGREANPHRTPALGLGVVEPGTHLPTTKLPICKVVVPMVRLHYFQRPEIAPMTATKRLSVSLIPAFRDRLSRFTVRDPSGCLLWTGAINSGGYGTASFKYDTVRMHRAAWIVANGVDVPKGMLVCHVCDVRNCVEPSHLFIGTRLDNLRDAQRKGRVPPPRAAYPVRALRGPLPIDVVQNIFLDPCQLPQAAAKYGVSKNQADSIRDRRSYRADTEGLKRPKRRTGRLPMSER